MNLNQITVPTLDIEKAITFYQSIGLHLIVKSPHYARFECEEGEATFSVHKVENLPQGEGITVYFERTDLDIYVALLQEKGIIFEELPTDKSWLWREARLKDPDRNQLILYVAGENRKKPSWRI